MMFIKNNQALEIKIYADDDCGFLFNQFVENEGLEQVSDYQWLDIKKPDNKRFSADDLKSDYRVYELMDELASSVIDYMDLNEEEASILSREMNDNNGYSFEIARKGLLSLSFIDWMNNLAGEIGGNDWKEAMAEFSHIARGNDYSHYAVIYIQGIGDDEALIAEIVNNFKMYAFESPYWYQVELTDCSTGNVIDEDSLGGIYDDSYQLEYLFETITESLDNMPELNKELRDMAVDELSKMDYSSVNW